MSNSVHFYAKNTDLIKLSRELSRLGDYRFFPCDHSDTEKVESFEKIELLPNIGLSMNNDFNHNTRYLMLPKDQNLVTRRIGQQSGTIKYAVDELANPGSCTFLPSGIFNSEIVIVGRFSTTHSDSIARQTMKNLRSAAIKAGYKKIKAYLVGIEAMGSLRSGMRLTHAQQTPALYDLILDK